MQPEVGDIYVYHHAGEPKTYLLILTEPDPSDYDRISVLHLHDGEIQDHVDGPTLKRFWSKVE